MLIWLIMLVFISVPIYTFIRMLQSFFRRTQSMNNGSVRTKVVDVYFSFGVYGLLMFGFFLNNSALNAGERLIIFEMNGNKANGYASLANEHIVSVIVLLTLGLISFWILSLSSYERLSPIVYVLLSTLVISNIVFSITYLTHTGFSHDGEGFSVFFLQLSFISLVFLFIARLKDSLNQFLDNQHKKENDYKNRFLQLLYKLSNHYEKMPKLWVISLFPVIILIQLILVLFGQRPDSFIRVFLETSSFNYSIIPAPEPEIVEGDGHYLCTVSAKGHKKLVKPIRAGIRRGNKIPVNRQLLIANAFENILEQYTPKLHKVIRRLYDTYGYPISRHINSKWSADLVYLLMKPLEWIFLIVLYSVDKSPENRIHMQYSELRK